jgi:hypothetical protein
MALAGTAMSAMGQYQQGQAAKAAGRYNQQAAEAEAKRLEMAATAAVAEGTHKQAAIAREQKRAMAAQIAAAAAGGGDSTDATAIAFQREGAANALLDQLVVAAQSEAEAQDLRYGAGMKRIEGYEARRQGDMAARAGTMSALGSAIQGGMSWYDTFGKP